MLVRSQSAFACSDGEPTQQHKLSLQTAITSHAQCLNSKQEALLMPLHVYRVEHYAASAEAAGSQVSPAVCIQLLHSLTYHPGIACGCHSLSHTTLHCRTLNNFQLLAHQLSPLMHSFRQQLIDQALHAANTAATAATAADNGTGPGLDNSNADPATAHVISTTAQQGAPVHVPSTAAAAAVTAFSPPTDGFTLNLGPTPFANSEEAVAVGPALLSGGAERPGRRQEISGSLPLEQMLSRLPSPIASAASLDRASSDEAPSSSRFVSRLGSSLNLAQAAFHQSPSPAPTEPPAPGPDSAADPNAAHHTQDSWSSNSFGQRSTSQHASRLGSVDNTREGLTPEHSQLPAMQPQALSPPQVSGRLPTDAAAAIAPTSSQAEVDQSWRTVYSAQGLLPASELDGHSSTQSTTDTALPSVSHEAGLASRLSPAASSPAADPGSSLAGEPSCGTSTPQHRGCRAVNQGAVDLDGRAVTHAEEGDTNVAQLEAEAEARIKRQQQQQHPWLLYFYDRDIERDYSRYHAQHMTMVRQPGTQGCQCLRRGVGGGGWSCWGQSG